MNYELSHDLLAKVIYAKVSSESRARRKLERYVSDKFAVYQVRNLLLSKDDLDYILPYLEVVKISKEELFFIESSKKALLQKKRKTQLLVLSVILFLSVLSIVSVWQWRLATASAKEALLEKQKAEDSAIAAQQSDSVAQEQTVAALYSDSIAKEQAVIALAERDRAQRALAVSYKQKNKIRAQVISAKARIALIEKDETLAFSLAAEAWSIAPIDEAVNVLSEIMVQYSEDMFYHDKYGFGQGTFELCLSSNDSVLLFANTDAITNNILDNYFISYVNERLYPGDRRENLAGLSQGGYSSAAQLSNDSKWIALGKNEMSSSNSLVIFNLETKEIRRSGSIDHQIDRILFSPNNIFLIVISLDNKWTLLNNEGRIISNIKMPPNFNITFDPDDIQNSTSASVLIYNGTKVIKEVVNNEFSWYDQLEAPQKADTTLSFPPIGLTSFNPGYGGINFSQFSKNGRFLFLNSGHQQGDMVRFEISNGKIVKGSKRIIPLQIRSDSITRIVISPNGRYFVYEGKRYFYFQDVQTGKAKRWQYDFNEKYSFGEIDEILFTNHSQEVILIKFRPIPTTGYAEVGGRPSIAFHFDLNQIDYQFTLLSLTCDGETISLPRDSYGAFVPDRHNQEHLSCLENWLPKLTQKGGFKLNDNLLVDSHGRTIQRFYHKDSYYNLSGIRFLEDQEFLVGLLNQYYWNELEAARILPRWDFIWGKGWVYKLDSVGRKQYDIDF